MTSPSWTSKHRSRKRRRASVKSTRTTRSSSVSLVVGSIPVAKAGRA